MRRDRFHLRGRAAVPLIGAFATTSGNSRELFAPQSLIATRGGGHRTILACGGLSAIADLSGTAATFSRFAYPEMRRHNSRRFFSWRPRRGGHPRHMIPAVPGACDYGIIPSMISSVSSPA